MSPSTSESRSRESSLKRSSGHRQPALPIVNRTAGETGLADPIGEGSTAAPTGEEAGVAEAAGLLPLPALIAVIADALFFLFG